MAARIATLKTQRTRTRKPDLGPVVEALRQSREVTHNIRLGGKATEVPASAVIAEVLEWIVTALFPTHLGPQGLGASGVDQFVGNLLSTGFTRLTDQVARGLQFDTQGLSTQEAQQRADDIVAQFAGQLPKIRGELVSDLRAAQQRDPTVKSLSEVLICFRSTSAVIHHRLAHALHELGARLVARMISGLAHASTGIDIHPGARIGPGFFISSGTGVVIGETSVIGENVCLHQGVTLGESELVEPGAAKLRSLRHPVIGDNVVIHAGAAVLGRITIGAGSIIGGNVWLTRSIPAGSVVSQAQHAHSAIQTLD
ncbi:serine O-acetyltransferase [Aestuariivirga sp.]|uniref:serine O-acetyltransferase n=1 Tax=Aestuariivirga sp. TaxID=2650926 RepID=UPI003BA9A497